MHIDLDLRCYLVDFLLEAQEWVVFLPLLHQLHHTCDGTVDKALHPRLHSHRNACDLLVDVSALETLVSITESALLYGFLVPAITAASYVMSHHAFVAFNLINKNKTLMLFSFKTFLAEHVMWVGRAVRALKRKRVLLDLTTTNEVLLTPRQVQYLHVLVNEVHEHILRIGVL